MYGIQYIGTTLCIQTKVKQAKVAPFVFGRCINLLGRKTEEDILENRGQDEARVRPAGRWAFAGRTHVVRTRKAYKPQHFLTTKTANSFNTFPRFKLAKYAYVPTRDATQMYTIAVRRTRTRDAQYAHCKYKKIFRLALGRKLFENPVKNNRCGGGRVCTRPLRFHVATHLLSGFGILNCTVQLTIDLNGGPLSRQKSESQQRTYIAFGFWRIAYFIH